MLPIPVPRVGVAMGLVAMPPTIAAALVLAAGLGLYVFGLFAPLDGRHSR